MCKLISTEIRPKGSKATVAPTDNYKTIIKLKIIEFVQRIIHNNYESFMAVLIKRRLEVFPSMNIPMHIIPSAI